MNTYHIALAGNPNSGKTTLFNHLTGSNQKVGNWAGVTIEKKVGQVYFENDLLEIVDLPGIYGLSAYSKEEDIALDYLLKEKPDLILNIIDGNNFERNFYLSLQLMLLEIPCFLVVNMSDELEKKGIKIAIEKLSELTQMPVISISAVSLKDNKNLLGQLHNALIEKKPPRKNLPSFGSALDQEIESLVLLMDTLELPHLSHDLPKRWLATKVLENTHVPLVKSLPEVLTSRRQESFDYESEMVHQVYLQIEEIAASLITKEDLPKNPLHEALDQVFTNRWLGLPLFGLLMYVVFWLTFSVGGIFLDAIDYGFSELLSPFLSSEFEVLQVAPWLTSLIVDGVVAGVGSVLTFLPNILILFLAIALLEDTGYMARVAFIMDRLMGRIGLNGKAIVPMIMGFGCNAPAIMGTRILENESDRLIAILINPFMSCGARLPIYVLLSSVFFAETASLVTFSLYLLGIFVAIMTALLFKNTLFKSSGSPFLLELPPYRLPSLKGLYLKVSHHGSAYVKRAGTIIFMASMVIWFVLNFGPQGYGDLTGSFGKTIGTFIAPIFSPLGFGNWQASLSLLTGIVAKEIVISNMAIIYGLGDVGASISESGMSTGLSQIFTPVSAYAFMVFSLLYVPCIAVIGIIKSETSSWKWPLFSMAYTFFVAWVMSFLANQLGHLFF